MSIEYSEVGQADNLYEEDGTLCDHNECPLPALYRFHNGRGDYVYGCDDHEHWAERRSRLLSCTSCGLETTHWKLWHETPDGFTDIVKHLCPDCYAMAVSDRPDTFGDDEPLATTAVEEDLDLTLDEEEFDEYD